MVVVDCIHQVVGKKSAKHHVHGVYYAEARWECPLYLSWMRSYWITGHFPHLLHLPISCCFLWSLCSWLNHGPSAKVNPSSYQWMSQHLGGEFSQLSHHVREDIGMIGRIYLAWIYLAWKDFPLISPFPCLDTQFVASGPSAPRRPLCESLVKHPAFVWTISTNIPVSSAPVWLLQVVGCLSQQSPAVQALTASEVPPRLSHTGQTVCPVSLAMGLQIS